MTDEEREAALKAELAYDDAFRDKVLRAFFHDGELTNIPSQLKKKIVIYRHIGELFETGREYSEGQVNAILLGVYPDFCTIRRGLIDAGILDRENGVYKRREGEELAPHI